MTAENYEPYGDLWKKQMKDFTKAQLIELLQITYKKNYELVERIKIKPEEKKLVERLEGVVYGNSREPQTAG